MNRLVAIVLVSAAVAAAQTNRGAISGTVTDQTLGIVPGAAVTVTNLGTNEIRRASVSPNGTFMVTDLEPVLYKVTVTSTGFNQTVVNNVKVDTASTATVNVTLLAGSVETKITVSAQAGLVNTESGTASNTVTQREIEDVPLLNRSVLDLALTLPNVSGDAGSEDPGLVSNAVSTTCPGCNLSVGGGRPFSTMMMADGTNNTGVSLARTIVSFTPETVQEFTVQTSAFSAQYGTTGGGIINVTTKSGTNDFHGTALWYNRNPDFAAAPFTIAATNRPVPTLKNNQFSLAAGGPVWIPRIYHGRNKTFWFAAIEPQYRRDHLDQYGLLPTPGMRSGDFSDVVNTPSGWLPKEVVQQFQSIAPNAVGPLGDSTIYDIYTVNGNQFTQTPLAAGQTTYAPFPGNVIPKSMLDATAQKALPFVAPASQYFLNSNGLISNLMAPRQLRQNETRYTVRVDHTISDNNRLYGRFTATPIVAIMGTPVSPTNDVPTWSWAKQAMLADTHTFSPTLYNDLRLNYTRGRFTTGGSYVYNAATGQNLNTEWGLPSITAGGMPTLSSLFPGSALGGGGSTATGLGGAGSTNNDDREERYTVSDLVYKNLGNMNLTFGVDASHALQNVLPLYGTFGGIYGFSNQQTDSTGTSAGTGGSPWASFMLGVPSGNITMRNVAIPYYYRWNSGAAFIQDDWKVKPNLTINLGGSLQPPNAADREIRPPGRIPSRPGADRQPGLAPGTSGWVAAHDGADSALRFFRCRRQFALPYAAAIHELRAASASRGVPRCWEDSTW